MRLIAILVIFSWCAACGDRAQTNDVSHQEVAPIALVIHGGAGTITKASLTAELEKEIHAKLNDAINAGYAVLADGGSSLDAVVVTIKILEDSPLFNAGKGAVFTHEGRNELDASIMEGQQLRAGAVAGVTTIKNPITAAHAVMTRSPHVMLAGAGAELFAEEQGLELVPNSYFFDSVRYKQLQRQLSRDSEKDAKFGTVGCVALDRAGNISAGTSTGGMTNKKYGRIGDAPIIGAGTYANNETCGISSTGWGEYFIRLGVAFDISALVEYKGVSLQEAAHEVILKKLPELGGSGGVIGLNRKGEIIMVFNTEGMYRGFRRQDEEAQTFIYGNEN